MSSSSSLVSSSRRIGEEEEDNEKPALTGMNLGFQHLEERIIAERTTPCTNTQLRGQVPSISDIVGCDITIEDIQSAKQTMIKQKVDSKIDVNESQKLTPTWNDNNYVTTPMIHFCRSGICCIPV